MYPNLLERFLTYVKINTRSDSRSKTTPTTESQKLFNLNVLKPEMERIGLTDIHYIEENGFLIGTLPATDPSISRKIGFIAHVDTADYNAENIQPQVVENYDGQPILLAKTGAYLDPKDFEARKQVIADLVAKFNHQLGEDRLTLDMYDQYYNMRQIIEQDMTSFDLAVKVMTDLGITVDVAPILGGTDGSKISFMGIPTPNLFAGWENAHGCYEFVSLQTMARAVDVIIGIASHQDA